MFIESHETLPEECTIFHTNGPLLVICKDCQKSDCQGLLQGFDAVLRPSNWPSRMLKGCSVQQLKEYFEMEAKDRQTGSIGNRKEEIVYVCMVTKTQPLVTIPPAQVAWQWPDPQDRVQKKHYCAMKIILIRLKRFFITLKRGIESWYSQ